MTQPENLPVLVPLAQAPRVLGGSRSYYYRAHEAGEIELRKMGRTTMVVTASALAHFARLPTLKPKSAA